MPKRKAKPYFKNRIEAIQKIPSEMFEPMDYDMVMNANYSFPPTVLCIIREHKHSGRVKEHIYQRGYAANRKIKQLITNEQEFTIIDQEGCQHIYPTLPLYDDPLA